MSEPTEKNDNSSFKLELVALYRLCVGCYSTRFPSCLSVWFHVSMASHLKVALAFQFISFTFSPISLVWRQIPCVAAFIYDSSVDFSSIEISMRRESAKNEWSQCLLMMHIANCIGIKWHNKWDNEKIREKTTHRPKRRWKKVCERCFIGRWVWKGLCDCQFKSIEWCLNAMTPAHNTTKNLLQIVLLN